MNIANDRPRCQTDTVTQERHELQVTAAAVFPLVSIPRRRQADIVNQLVKIFGVRKVGTIAVLAAIDTLAFEPADRNAPKGWCVDSVDRIAEKAGLKRRRSAEKILERLETDGWITVRGPTDPNWPARFGPNRRLRALCWPNLEAEFERRRLQWSLFQADDEHPQLPLPAAKPYNTPSLRRGVPSEEERDIINTSSSSESTPPRPKDGVHPTGHPPAADTTASLAALMRENRQSANRQLADHTRQDAQLNQLLIGQQAILRAVNHPARSPRPKDGVNPENLPIRDGEQWDRVRNELESQGDFQWKTTPALSEWTAAQFLELLAHNRLIAINGRRPFSGQLIRTHVTTRPPGTPIGPAQSPEYIREVEQLRRHDSPSRAFVNKFLAALSESQQPEFWRVAPANRISADPSAQPYAPMGAVNQSRPCAVDHITGYRANAKKETPWRPTLPPEVT